MNKFYAGFAKKKITPPLGTLLAGYPRDRFSNRVLDDLYVSAIAMKQGDKSALLLSVDVCALIEDACNVIRSSIEQVAPVKKEDILVFAIHTHSGPITKTTPGWGTADVNFLTSILYPQCVEAAKEAFACLQDAKIAVASVESKAGMNRRQIKDGNVILGQNPDGAFDPDMTVVRFCALDGAPIASFVHYSCHPTTVGSNLSITRDWPGLVVDHIEKLSGAGCLYMNGSEGDVGPRLSNGKTTGDESYLPEMGAVACADAQKAYEAATEFYVPELKTFTGDVFIPFKPAPTLEEIQARIDALPEKLEAVDIRKNAQYQNIKKMILNNEEFPTGQYLQQTVLSLGDLAFVPGPFETFTGIALAIKAASPFARTIYVGLANGCLGYLPTVEQLPYGGYEVASFRAVGITGFVENTSELFTDGCIQLLRQLKEY